MRLKILAAVLLLLTGCEKVVNSVAFHPDTTYHIPDGQLPEGIRSVTVPTPDALDLHGLFLPDTASRALVIYFHGNAGNIFHRIPDLQSLSGFNINVLGVSYRGYGKSPGTPTEQGIYIDGQAVFDYAVKTLEFKPADIIIFGRSLGTAVAVHTAQKKEIAGLILVTPITSAADQARAMGISSAAVIGGSAFDNLTKIRDIVAPVLIIHGTHDQVLPYRMGRDLFNAARTTRSFITIRGAGHNNLATEYADHYWKPIGSFISRWLKING